MFDNGHQQPGVEYKSVYEEDFKVTHPFVKPPKFLHLLLPRYNNKGDPLFVNIDNSDENPEDEWLQEKLNCILSVPSAF